MEIDVPFEQDYVWFFSGNHLNFSVGIDPTDLDVQNDQNLSISYIVSLDFDSDHCNSILKPLQKLLSSLPTSRNSDLTFVHPSILFRPLPFNHDVDRNKIVTALSSETLSDVRGCTSSESIGEMRYSTLLHSIQFKKSKPKKSDTSGFNLSLEIPNTLTNPIVTFSLMSQNVIPDAAEAKLKVLSVSPSTQKKAKKDQLPNDSVIPSILGTFFLQFGVSLSETNPPSVDSSTFLIDLAASLKSKLTIASFGVLADSIIQFITFFKQSAEELEDETFEATEILEHADQDLAINSVLQPDQLTVNVSDVPDALVFSRRDIIHSHDENAPEINADIVEATISKWCADNERTEIQGDLVKEVMDKCQQWLDDKVEPAEDYDLSAKKENRCQVTFETKEDDEEEEEEESKEEEEEDFNEGEGQSEEEEDREEKEDSGNGNNEDGFSHNSGESESSEEEATTPKTPLSTRRSQTSHKSVRSQRESKRENDPEKEDDMKEIEGDEDEPQTQRPPPTPVSRAGAMAGHSESEPQKLEEQVEDTAVDGEDVGKSTKTQDGTKANEKEEKQGQQKTTPQTRSVQTKSAEQRAMNEQKRKEMEKERAAKIQEQIRIKNQEKEQRMKEEKLRKEAEKKKKEEENKRKEEEARKRKNDLEKQKKERFLSEFKPKSNQPKHKPKLDDNQKNEILKIRKEFLDTFIDDTL
ncbi:hypothetical protein BLNAU_2181 [Blattamonas nauphoetae]|uniref:Uncharacterized protein n=1 Tax=Blattamonas nauphoetae TaxID=2049346 RepID=A0ABQ9YG53_9EUKA|nr:hypothetical protein BLNAU_2181 [Blattamonas nauphoetae]